MRTYRDLFRSPEFTPLFLSSAGRVAASTVSGLALGLQGSGMLAMQGIGAAIAGTIAQQTTPALAMTVMAAMSVAVTLALAPGLRPVPASPGPAGQQPAARPHRLAKGDISGVSPAP